MPSLARQKTSSDSASDNAANQGLASILKCVTHTSFDVPVANDGKRSSSTTLHNLVEHSKSTSIDEEPTKPTRINIYKHLFYDPIYVDKLIEDNQLLLNDCLEPNLNLDHSTKQFHIDNPTDYLLSNSTLSSNQPFSTIFSDSDVIGDDTLIENHSPKYSKIYTTQVESEHDFCFEFDTDTELEDISNNMASTANAPPPPPPLPGTNGALSMPNWRQHPHPVRESAPSEEQIKKQQYAHLPDKLLNTMNKDKKPFTYTPQGIGDKGVLDLSEIRSPKMKKRLIANLHSGEEECFSTDDESSRPGSSCSKQTQPVVKNLNQQPYACVLPPLDSVKLRPVSPNMPSTKKEVRFAPSPILVSDDEEFCNLLEKRRQDVESRSKICTNQPESETNLQPTPLPVISHVSAPHYQMPPSSNLQPQPQQQQQQQKQFVPQTHIDPNQLMTEASTAVQSARNIFGFVPNHSETTFDPKCDSNNNPTTINASINETICEQADSFPSSASSNVTSIMPQHQHQNVAPSSVPPVSAPTLAPSYESVTPTQMPVMVKSVEQDESGPTPLPSHQQTYMDNVNNCQKSEATEETEEDVRNMINRIESDLNEMRLKEHVQSSHHQQQQPPPPEQQIAHQQACELSPQSPRLTSTTLAHSEEYPGSSSGPRLNNVPQTTLSSMYQQSYQTPSQQYDGSHNARSDILKQLLDDGLQDAIDSFEAISRETTNSSSSHYPQQSNSAYQTSLDSNSYEVPSPRKVAPPVPSKPARNSNPYGPVDGRVSCPPEYSPVNYDGGYGSSFRCISPSMEILKNVQSSSYQHNQRARPFYRANNDGMVDLSQPSPAPMAQNIERTSSVQSEFQPKREKMVYTNQIAPPDPNVVRGPPNPLVNTLNPPETEDEERIMPVQQQIARREQFAVRQFQRKQKTTKNFVNNCANTSSRPTMPQYERENLAGPRSYNNSESERQYLPELGMFSQLPPKGNNMEMESPTSPKMYYGSLPRKVQLNNRGQLQDLNHSQFATLPKSYVNKEEGRQFLPKVGMYSQLPPKVQQKNNLNELPQLNEMNESESLNHQTNNLGHPYSDKESGRELNLSTGMYSQLPPKSMTNESQMPSTSLNQTVNGRLQEKSDAREYLPSSGMFSQLPSKSSMQLQNSQIGHNDHVHSYGQSNGKPYVDTEEGRSYISSAKMFTQLPPGEKRQQSLPPVNRGSVELWTPPPTPPLAPVVNRPEYAQQKSKLSLQQIRRLPPSERPVEPTPSKYTGSHIPSRSFRLLQLITGEDIENQYADTPTKNILPPRPASSLASFGRPQNPPPPPPTQISNSDYGTDF